MEPQGQSKHVQVGKPGAHSLPVQGAVMPRMAVKSHWALQTPRAIQEQFLLQFPCVRKGTMTHTGWSTEHNKRLLKLNITLPREIQTLLL